MPTITVTRVTHSCHLIEIGGKTILTDPWFSTREGYYPGEPVAFTIAELPRLDAVIITHEHYDHCDMDAFTQYRDHAVPMFVAKTAVEKAEGAGFTNVSALEPWDSVDLDGVQITAIPAKHGVYEVTFALGDGESTVYFGGDTMLIPELFTIEEHVGQIDLALLPTNGLKIIPQDDLQVVMDAEQAAELVAALKPKLAIPHHYAFTSGSEGDRTITKTDKNPQHFADAVARLAPDVEVRIVAPGTRVQL